MAGWVNWSGRQTASPRAIVRPTTELEFVEAVRRARGAGWPVRAVGASHSHSRVAATDGLLVETDGWQGLVSVDTGPTSAPGGRRPIATVRSGTRIHRLGGPLFTHGLALVNQGDIDRQSVAGAVATGTHGTGRTLQSLSAAVTGVRLVLADGELVACSPSSEPDLFEVARHSLGGVGLVTEIELAVRARYRLHERRWSASPDEVLADIDRLAGATRHFEFFWVPDRDRCACKSLDEVTDEAGGVEGLERPAGIGPDGAPTAAEQQGELERIGWSHQIISSIRDDKHTEMEYAVPAERGPACFDELRTMILDRFPELRWPLEYRSVAADDILISAARGRATVTISVHQDVELDERPLFEDCEAVFRRHDGRPHWGKVHHRTGAELAQLHPDWDTWWRIRDRYDPAGLFVTPDLAALRPA